MSLKANNQKINFPLVEVAGGGENWELLLDENITMTEAVNTLSFDLPTTDNYKCAYLSVKLPRSSTTGITANINCSFSVNGCSFGYYIAQHNYGSAGLYVNAYRDFEKDFLMKTTSQNNIAFNFVNVQLQANMGYANQNNNGKFLIYFQGTTLYKADEPLTFKLWGVKE